MPLYLINHLTIHYHAHRNSEEEQNKKKKKKKKQDTFIQVDAYAKIGDMRTDNSAWFSAGNKWKK